MLVQQLPAPAAGRQRAPIRGHADEGDKPPATPGVQRGHQPTFGAQREPVGSVLDVAADDDPGFAAGRPSRHVRRALDQRGGAHPQTGVRRVGTPRDLGRRGPQPRPDLVAHA